MKKEISNELIVKVQSGNTKALENAIIYVFDQQGQLIESTGLKNGQATLRTTSSQFEGKTQLIIGPALPKEFNIKKLKPLTIKKLGGYQPSVHINKDNVILINGLPDITLPIFNWCLITGSLSKYFNIDGQNKILPVCDSRVHICEVDRIRWWWPKIPIHIIDELSHKLKEIILNPKLIIPPHDPGPLRNLSRSTGVINNNSAIKNTTVINEARLNNLPAHISSGLLSASQITVRETIYNNFNLLHTYLCLWPKFWPYFYIYNEIGTAYTDCNGRFNLEYLNISNDKDIYIWVEVCINGHWTTVYRPSIPCYTRWNYTCGTDININITDPRVPPCSCGQQLKGEIVWFRSIGEYATALHIEQDDASTVNVQGVNMLNVGCTDILLITEEKKISPFGSILLFKVLFGDGLPKSGITHYRWKKTMIKDAAVNDILVPQTSVVNGMVLKNYFIITTDESGMHFETKAVTLGAEGIDENIGYRIPHWDIYQDPGVPAEDKLKTIQWTSPDFWSASIGNSFLDNGTWRFDLELLNQNAGTFQPVQVPKHVFQVSDENNSGTSVNAPDDYLNPPDTNIPNAFNLQVKVRIDNERCTAVIQDANITVNGVIEHSGTCGFLHYTNVNQLSHISFIAAHPRNFAKFNFRVIKGNGTQNPGIDQEGYVISSIGEYTLNGETFSADIPVSTLIGNNCPQAAFAEQLNVISIATDGSNRLDGYDAPDSKAFALSNT